MKKMGKEQLIGNLELRHITSLIKEGKRLDNRGLLDIRSLEIIPGVIEKAEGSAEVRLGDTRVIAGIKGLVGEPFADTPDQAVQIVNMELSPIASPFFEPGPPQKDAIELARVVDRGLRESKAVKLKDPNLVVEAGKHVWIIFIDIYVIDHHGNLFDASIIAAMAALMHTKLPKVTINDNGEVEKSEEETVDIPLSQLAASLTFGKVMDTDAVLVDPTIEEERCLTSRFTVALTEDGNVCSLQKGMAGTFSQDEIYKMLDIAQEKIPELISKVKSH